MISRFVLGIGAFGRFMSGTLILLEWAGPKIRAKIFFLLELGWTGGAMLVPIAYYFVRDFRYMQLIVFFYELIFIFWIWKTPETPQWLLLNGKFQEAEKVLTEAIIMNNKGTAEDVRKKMGILRQSLMMEEEERKLESKKSLFDLWKSPILLKYSMALYFIWFTMSFVSYGFQYNTSSIGGSIYVTFFFFGALALAQIIVWYFIVDYFKRKTFTIILTGLGALALFAMVPFVFVEWGTNYRQTFAILGKFFMGGTWNMIYLMSAEIFPTGMRQLGMGSCSVAARIASILAPFTKELAQYLHVSGLFALYGTLGAIATLLIFVLPETKDKTIPNSIKDAELLRKRKKKILETDL